MAKTEAKGNVISPDLEAQRVYAKKLATSGFDFSLVVADAFIRGIRDIGYKHTGTAIDELIDNAVQAEASAVHIVFGYDEESDKKPGRLASGVHDLLLPAGGCLAQGDDRCRQDQ